MLLCDRTSDTMEVSEARKQLFMQKSRSLENIPPTQAALKQDIKWASYQANCWKQALTPDLEPPSPSDWGWRKDTTLPEASQSCYELIPCGCRKGCTGQYKCVKATLKCAALCSCSAEC
ncbi:UNVERIFIED_CONTAM: hypothetical protein FKN15_029328 [Acipenser sinensis]